MSISDFYYFFPDKSDCLTLVSLPVIPLTFPYTGVPGMIPMGLANNRTIIGCSSTIPDIPMTFQAGFLCRPGKFRHVQAWDFLAVKKRSLYINASISYSTFIPPGALTMNEPYIAHHFPSQQHICLQECKHCFAIILWGGCSHNCPD